MPKRLLLLSPTVLAALSFAAAGLVMLLIALGAALVIESRSESVVSERLAAAGMDWVGVESDGLQVFLTGTAPTEAARFTVLNLVGSVVDSSRIRDGLDVAPASALAPPRFSVEMLRNDDGIQLIGLIPKTTQIGGLTAADLAQAAAALTPGVEPANMLQAAEYAPPETWDAALRFGLEALKMLERSKISVMADRVEVTAIADSAEEKRQFEADLMASVPEGVKLVADISAPRPVITPFTLRFIKDATGARFDACSADTARAQGQILAAAREAGMTEDVACTIGMGVPSPRWGEAAAAGIRAVAALNAGTLTFSDTDITLVAGDGVTQAEFDRVVGELRASLPDVFSLDATPPRAETAAQGPAEFTATLSAEGKVELRGRLVDETQQAAVDAFARAQFGADLVYVATLLDQNLPDGWPVRVLAGLEALGQLHDGSLLVRSDLVEVKGVTGSQEARAKITQILSSRLGQGQTFRVDVRYDEELDPLAALPTPEECEANLRTVMASQKITFTPGSAEIASEAGPVIDALAKILQDCPGLWMEIAGHTDSQGSEGGNQALSQARAEAVLIALQGRRVDVSGMTAVGYGEALPIADNETEAGREANRRIEFVLKQPGGAVAAAVEAAVESAAAPDFSTDDSPSVAPSEKTMRPKPRPARED
ncbi:OmpA family protein [Rhodobacter sp. Har01]|uniref:OmpA family protein n=1 Tax=Rhodobacter sp. Har01 TaxID=2883999 RepID=UPI001D0666AA|nr:OmpA family protein [Rhodobacter sp. Har01]MCB6179148.1 OmpA family protein [Rhodobacter sp. Har01]